MEGAKATAFFRKPNKKKVNDELDRIKQAEKKKRRLEKLLATSAAIRSELEKKRLMKKEEQERLDEEGAAIAEAVALHVLIGEDSDDIDRIMMNNDRGLPSWDRSGNMRAVLGTRQPNLWFLLIAMWGSLLVMMHIEEIGSHGIVWKTQIRWLGQIPRQARTCILGILDVKIGLQAFYPPIILLLSACHLLA